MEGLKLDPGAIQHLGKVGEKTGSLRFVTQLLTPASILSATNGRETITEEGMHKHTALFLTTNR